MNNYPLSTRLLLVLCGLSAIGVGSPIESQAQSLRPSSSGEMAVTSYEQKTAYEKRHSHTPGKGGTVQAEVEVSSRLVVGESVSKAFVDIETAGSCKPTLNESFTRFAIAEISGEHKGHIVVRQDFNIGEGCFDGHVPARVTVSGTAIDFKNKKMGKEIWKFSAKAVSGHVEDERYILNSPGCCAQAPTTKQFSLQTGRLLGSYTDDLVLSLALQSVLGHRYISIERDSASDPSGPGPDATLFYFDSTRLYQAVSISSGEIGECYVHRFHFLGGEPAERRRFRNSTSFSGEQVVIELGYSSSGFLTKITVPLLDNRFDIEKAVIEAQSSIRLTDVTSDIKQ